jgi:hypothetical protein
LPTLRKYTKSQSFIVQVLWLAGFTAGQISRAVSSVGLMPMTERSVKEFVLSHMEIRRGAVSAKQRQDILDSMLANRSDNGILGDAAFKVVR